MLLPVSPLDNPETRRAWVEEALAAWDTQRLSEAVVYAHRLFRWHEKHTLSVAHNLIYWCRERNYQWPHLPQNALLLFWQEVTGRRPPLSARPIRKDTSQYAWYRGLRRFFEVLQWAGVKVPPLEMPRKPHYALIRPHFSDKEFARLLEGARHHPEGRLRRLGVALLYLLGESGVWMGELYALRLEDFDPQARTLRVRGRRAREIPLSKEAAEAIRAYLEDREAVVSLSPIPPPYLFVRMTNKKGGLGKALNRDTVVGLLERILQMAEISHERPTGALRWRAVRRYLAQGLAPEEVTKRTGVASVADLD